MAFVRQDWGVFTLPWVAVVVLFAAFCLVLFVVIYNALAYTPDPQFPLRNLPHLPHIYNTMVPYRCVSLAHLMDDGSPSAALLSTLTEKWASWAV